MKGASPGSLPIICIGRDLASRETPAGLEKSPGPGGKQRSALSPDVARRSGVDSLLSRLWDSIVKPLMCVT